MRPRKDDPHLSLNRIVDAGWAVVDDGGLEALSTRRIAARLGVRSPALYHHVPTMQALMGLMIEDALRNATVAPEQCRDWRDWLRRTAFAHRAALLAHRDSGLIMSQSAPSAGMKTRFVPAFMAAMKSYRFSDEEASAAAGALGSLILGFVLNEQQEAHHRFAATIMPEEATFAFTIDLLILGLEARLGERGIEP